MHARSISPCDPHIGIGVLFEYPACILDRADRVRLFAKLRADVASLAPPTSLHYVTEQRVIRGQHSLHFDCDLFSEKYVEYCFVYVSQAISGKHHQLIAQSVRCLAQSKNGKIQRKKKLLLSFTGAVADVRMDCLPTLPVSGELETFEFFFCSKFRDNKWGWDNNEVSLSYLQIMQWFGRLFFFCFTSLSRSTSH